jgi:hypothetical protein
MPMAGHGRSSPTAWRTATGPSSSALPEVRGAAMTLETAADFAKSPRLAVLDQTTKDEFVPMNQKPGSSRR